MFILIDNVGSIVGSTFNLVYSSVDESKENKTTLHQNLEAESSYSFWHAGDFFKDDFDSTDFYTGEQVSGTGNGVDYFIQNVGLKNRLFTVKGAIIGMTLNDIATGKTVFRSLVGTSGSLTSNFIPNTTIFYKNVSFEDDANSPLKSQFNLEVVEII